MDQQSRDGGAIARNQHVVYVMPHDWASIAHFLGPLIDRIDPDVPGPQLLAITGDAETAAAVAAAAVRLVGERRIGIVAATGARRAARLLRAAPAPPHILAGDPATLVELVGATLLRTSELRAVAVAWADELVSGPLSSHLDTLFTEIPREIARTFVTATASPEVDALVERYARRARRVVASGGSEAPVATIEYVTTAVHSRAPALRRLLDEADPASAIVYVRTDDSAADASTALRTLGYGADDTVRVSRGGVSAEMAILFDLPASREELREAVGPQPARVIALVQPRQLSSLRALAGQGVRPFVLPEAATRARGREDSLRSEIRELLDRGSVARELLTLEPLLELHDGIEIAAAVLQLLEAERTRPAVQAVLNTPHGGRAEGPMTRIFLGIGERDGVKPGDLVGAIAGEAGISSAEIGRIDIRESHSVVQVSSPSAQRVIEAVNGTSICGRRVMVREDRPREDRPGPARGGDRRPAGRAAGAAGGGARRPGRPAGAGGRDAPRPRSDRSSPPRRRD